MSKTDFLVVGAGFFGSVIAQCIASQLGKNVVVIDKRDHIGGNCHSQKDSETGIEFHSYGTHIFHTSNEKVWNYLQPFTAFNGYRHQVLTQHKGRVYQMPINLETINDFYSKSFTPQQAKTFMREEIAHEYIERPKNLEQKAISLIGRPLYEAFIKGYTEKQWGMDASELPASIINRLPMRYNYNEDYFNHCRWQGIPIEGYTAIFERMLDHPKIRVELECDYFSARERFDVACQTIYTGALDQYFDYALGKLEWRSIRLEKKIHDVEDFQGTSVMNYADNDIAHTRIHEPRHLHPERNYRKDKTLTLTEYPQMDANNPYYPINTPDNNALRAKYRELQEKETQTLFGGRLADYAYYDMDMTISAALKLFETKIQPYYKT